MVPWLHYVTSMRRNLVLAAIATVAACGPPGVDPPDAGDDDPDGDVEMGGIELRWTAPELGADLDGVRIDRIRLSLRDVRVVGDATPGDETYRASEEIALGDDDGEVDRIVFGNAPPGRYSAVEFALSRALDGKDAWRLDGECAIEKTEYSLGVSDDQSASVSLPLDLVLGAGETRIVRVEIDVSRIVDDIDWSMAEIEEGELHVEGDSPLMAQLRAGLIAAFSIDGID